MKNANLLTNAVSEATMNKLQEMGVSDPLKQSHLIEVALINLLARVSLHRVFAKVEKNHSGENDIVKLLEARISYLGKRLGSSISSQMSTMADHQGEIH